MSGSKPQAIPVTPKSNFSGPVIVDPVTRIEGHLRIDATVENGKIVDVRSSSQLFRGLKSS
jgi:Ni,Fe-hydrogenase I large subunit